MKTNTTDRPVPVAVIIPHYNDVVRLGRCLAELAENDLTSVEVLVVDNGSTVPLVDVQSRFPYARFIVEPEKGAAAARNRGVSETTADVLLFIDSDCIPDRDWIAVARGVCDRADLTGGRVYVFDETQPPRSGAEAFKTIFAFDFKSYIEKKGFSGAGNLVTHRAVFDKIGGFLNGVSEDTEWTMRAVSNGYSLVYCDQLRVGHPSRQDWPALRTKWKRMTAERFKLNGPGLRPKLFWTLRALAMPFSAVAHVPKVLFSGKLDGVREHLAALGTLFRLRFARMYWMLRQVLGLPI
jgi:glycosyltransferase involved in cell wall biosynthesis